MGYPNFPLSFHNPSVPSFLAFGMFNAHFHRIWTLLPFSSYLTSFIISWYLIGYKEAQSLRFFNPIWRESRAWFSKLIGLWLQAFVHSKRHDRTRISHIFVFMGLAQKSFSNLWDRRPSSKNFGTEVWYIFNMNFYRVYQQFFTNWKYLFRI